jgi:hypothetical protein
MIALVPTAAFAADTASKTSGVLFRVNGDVLVAAGETVDSVVVINGNVVVDGRVNDNLWVINGNATISGSVGGDIVVIRGTVDLKPSATVKNVSLVRSDETRENGATITGSTHSYSGSLPGIGWGVRLLIWLSFTLLVLVAGLVFAATGGRQLSEMVGLIGARTGQSILAAVILWIAVPIAAIIALVTLVGIPIGIGILLFLLPALWFLGYLVSGTALGVVLLRALHTAQHRDHPYVAALLGLLLLQVAGLVPVIGWTVAFFAGLLGGGVLAYRLWAGWRGSVPSRPVTT